VVSGYRALDSVTQLPAGGSEVQVRVTHRVTVAELLFPGTAEQEVEDAGGCAVITLGEPEKHRNEIKAITKFPVEKSMAEYLKILNDKLLYIPNTYALHPFDR